MSGNGASGPAGYGKVRAGAAGPMPGRDRSDGPQRPVAMSARPVSAATAAVRTSRRRRAVLRGPYGGGGVAVRPGLVGQVGQCFGEPGHQITSAVSGDGSSVRRRASASWVWLFTVPTEHPSSDAVSASERSSKNRRTTTAR